MKEKDLQIFVETTVAFFAESTGESARIGVPFMRRENLILLDFTGLVGITGNQKGGIYFTAGGEMLRELAAIMLKNPEVSGEDIFSLIGEIANTISGNARTSFGPDFQLSVPAVFRGKPDSFRFQINPPTYVLPVSWKNHEGFLVIGID